MRIWFGTLIFLLAGIASPLGVLAHPHIFVTTRMVLEVNDTQQVTGVTMTWTYDDFF